MPTFFQRPENALKRAKGKKIFSIHWFSINHHALRGPNYVSDNTVNCIVNLSITFL